MAPSRRRFRIPYDHVTRALTAARAKLVHVQGPDWEDEGTRERFRDYVEREHDRLVSAAQHEITTALKTPVPKVTIAARAGAAYEGAWIRAVRGVDAEEEQFRILATLALAGGLLAGRDLADPEKDAAWTARAVQDAFDPRLIVHGAEWAGAAAIPLLRGRWAFGFAAALMALVVAAPALTGAFVLHEARRSTTHESETAGFLPEGTARNGSAPSLEAPEPDEETAASG